MEGVKTVLRLNVRGQGVVFVQAEDAAAEMEIPEFVPRVGQDLYGPGLAFLSLRTSPESYFISVLSRWTGKDEFGRRGLSLAHSELVTVDPADDRGFLRVCERLVGMFELHRQRFTSLGEMLETIATSGDEERARKLVTALERSSKVSFAGRTKERLLSLAQHLRETVSSPRDHIRVSTRFPEPQELGPCALIGLQAGLPAGALVGGGALETLAECAHIVAAEEVPGFRYVDLPAMEIRVPPATTTAPPPGRLLRPALLPVAAAGLLATVLVTLATLLVATLSLHAVRERQDKLIRDLETVALELKVGLAHLPKRPAGAPQVQSERTFPPSSRKP